MLSYPEGTRYTVLTPIRLREDRTLQQQLEIDLKQGFNRIEVNGEMKRIDEYTPVAGDEVYLLVDRMAAVSYTHLPMAERLLSGRPQEQRSGYSMDRSVCQCPQVGGSENEINHFHILQRLVL